MSIILLSAAATMLILIFWAILTRNGFVKKQYQIKEAWANVDICLKRKANILQNLVDTLRMQMKFEGDLLVKIAAARARMIEGDNVERLQTNDQINKFLPSVYAVMEQYPKFGATDSFSNLLGNIKDCEDKIMYVRKRYNLTVISYNMSLKAFPFCVMAKCMNLQAKEAYELSENERTEADSLRINDVR